MELSTLFDLKQLEAIRLVAEEKHFGRAAARAFVSPGTMSTRVKDFEDAVGYAVFHRTSRSVELTDRGAELIVLLEGPMRQLQEIFADGAGLDGKDVEISIATSSDTDRNNILAAINRLRTVYGAVRTERVGDKDLPQLFADESIHAAISWSTLDDLGLDTDDYVSGIVQEQTLHCVVSRSDPLADRESVGVDDLVGRKVVMFHRELGPSVYDVIMQFLRSSGHEPQLVAHQHSQASMADALDWNPGAVTFGSEANLPLLPDRFVPIPVRPTVSTPIHGHARRQWSGLLEEIRRFADDY